jgi:hypothetical protein
MLTFCWVWVYLHNQAVSIWLIVSFSFTDGFPLRSRKKWETGKIEQK